MGHFDSGYSSQRTQGIHIFVSFLLVSIHISPYYYPMSCTSSHQGIHKFVRSVMYPLICFCIFNPDLAPQAIKVLTYLCLDPFIYFHVFHHTSCATSITLCMEIVSELQMNRYHHQHWGGDVARLFWHWVHHTANAGFNPTTPTVWQMIFLLEQVYYLAKDGNTDIKITQKRSILLSYIKKIFNHAQ